MIPEQKPVTGRKGHAGISAQVAALVRFYDAFNSRDIAKMSTNRTQIDDIAMDYPVGGNKRGWNEIKEVYERIFSGKAKVYVEFYDYTLHETVDMFYVVGRERGKVSRRRYCTKT